MTPSYSKHVREEIERRGPVDAFRSLIASNDALLRGSDLDHGLEFAAARCAIYTELMGHWAAKQQTKLKYDRPFAVVALGGTGRGEMTPCSDTDFGFLFDDAIEGNAFLRELQRQVIHSDEFHEQCGFHAGALPFNLEDMPELETIQRNAFLDMKPVYDPHDLEQRFRDRIRATFDPFEHFLHVSSVWRERWSETKSLSERLDRFDIKKDGLRVFLAGIWTFAGRDFVHSHDMYRILEDRRDLEAYAFLLRIRSFVHLRRATRSAPSAAGNHSEDVLGFDDFSSFGAMLDPTTDEEQRFEFENTVRARLLSARRRVDRFARGVIGRALKEGREIRAGSAITYGVGGLRDTAAPTRGSNHEKSRAALAMLLASQRYCLPIDPSELEGTFRDPDDWLVPVQELSDLFYESRGSLADSFRFLSQLDDAMDRLFPGYRRFESSLDERVMTEQATLRGALGREKLRALEHYFRKGFEQLAQARTPESLSDSAHEVSIAVEAALLDANDLAAVKLALITKRLPTTPDDMKTRQNESLSLHERFSSGLSGIPLENYYTRGFQGAGFTDETLRLTRFLVENRRAFKLRANTDLNSARVVEEIVDLCKDEAQLRALFVFTCADRVRWESEEKDPSLWFNIRELFCKARMAFRPTIDPAISLAMAGYSPEQLVILKDLGDDFFAGVYGHYAILYGGDLLRLAGASPDSADARPRVRLIRRGTSVILSVAALDHPGIAACISGALWKRGIGLRQAHLFSAKNHGLAFDFFHLAPGASVVAPDVLKALEEAVLQRQLIGEDDQSGVPNVAEAIRLVRWETDSYCLRAETSGDVGALIYELTWKVFRLLRGNIFGLAAHTAHTGRGRAYVSVYHNLPDLTLEQAEDIIRPRRA